MMKRFAALLTAVLMAMALIPISAAAEPVRDTAVAEIRIYGYEDPVIGEISEVPELYTPDGAPYYVVMDDWDGPFWYNEDNDEWYPEEDPFAAGEHYDLCITVRLRPGYYYSDDVTVYVNDRTDLVDLEYTGLGDEEAGDYWVWTVPTLPVAPGGADNAIHEIRVDGFELPPEAGWESSEHLSFSVPEGAPYAIVENSPCWWDNSPDYDYVYEGILVEGVPYSIGMTVAADEGYYFAEDCVFYINGGEELVDTIYTGIEEYDPTIAYLWSIPVEAVAEEPEDPYAIHEVIVNGWGEPVPGMAGIDNMFLETPEGAPYFIIYGGWRDETDQQQMWGEEHVFIEGHEYSEGAQIWADEGYYFADDCVFTTQDEGVELDLEWCYVDEYENYICYMNTVPVVCGGAPAEHLWGDANGDGSVDFEDVLLIMRCAMGLTELDPENADPWCDVNGDGELNMNDALIVARYVNEMIDALPVF